MMATFGFGYALVSLFAVAGSSDMSECYQFQRVDHSRVSRESHDSCFVLGVGLANSNQHTGELNLPDNKRVSDHVQNAFGQTCYAFRQESSVVFGFLSRADFREFCRMEFSDSDQSSDNQRSEFGDDYTTSRFVVVFPKKKRDRTCLSIIPTSPKPTCEIYKGPISPSTITDFVNHHCQVFRSPFGMKLPQGLHEQYIMDNLFRLNSTTNITIADVYKSKCNPLNRSCDPNSVNVVSAQTGACSQHESCATEEQKNKYMELAREIPKCDRIPVPTRNDFFHRYVKLSRPVVIENGAAHWTAIHKWTNDFFKQKYGERNIHIKLAPGGNFEGVENASVWEDYATFKIPHHIRSQLQYPDLVVVRPAYLNVQFANFIDMIQNRTYLDKNISAYLEYSSIPNYLPELEKDIGEFNFVKTLLKRRHLNIWLSSGNTVGKLHFDPFDNLLCQLSGKKEVILFEPFNNSRLYEGHIPEAMLSYNETEFTFRRKTLKDSTSMVMSPVDITNPDLERFPAFKDAMPLNCTISAGDVLFMPSFWWHEVVSHPSRDGRNLAVNFWYEPFLTKDFPCAECPMEVNVGEYRDLL